MTALTAAWMKTPRSWADLLFRTKAKRNEEVTVELLRLKSEGHDVQQGFGFGTGHRMFYWVTQLRDTKRQQQREARIGDLDMDHVKEYEG